LRRDGIRREDPVEKNDTRSVRFFSSSRERENCSSPDREPRKCEGSSLKPRLLREKLLPLVNDVRSLLKKSSASFFRSLARRLDLGKKSSLDPGCESVDEAVLDRSRDVVNRSLRTEGQTREEERVRRSFVRERERKDFPCTRLGSKLGLQP